MPDHLPVYSALTATAILALQLALMLAVGSKRLAYGQGIGDGGHADLALGVRRHANLAENGAMFVVTLALLELVRGSTGLVMGLGLAFVVVRLSHAVGLSLGEGPNAPRFIGAMGTALCGFLTAGALAWSVLSP